MHRYIYNSDGGSPESSSSWVPGVVDALGVGVVVGEGNNDEGSVMHATMGELASPILTANAIPATSSERKNNHELELQNTYSFTYCYLVQ